MDFHNLHVKDIISLSRPEKIIAGDICLVELYAAKLPERVIGSVVFMVNGRIADMNKYRKKDIIHMVFFLGASIMIDRVIDDRMIYVIFFSIFI